MEKFVRECARPRFGHLRRGVLAENEVASIRAVMRGTLELSEQIKLKRT